MSAEAEKLAEGKTKIIWSVPGEPSYIDSEQKDVVTWNNQFSKRMPGKGVATAVTSVAIFSFLRRSGFPIAFKEYMPPKMLRMERCDMIPLEVVVRGEIDAKSSFLKREPSAETGVRLKAPIIEFYLKTSVAEWQGITLPSIDPLITNATDAGVWVHHPKEPVLGEGTFIPASLLWGEERPWSLPYMSEVARRIFIALRGGFDAIKFNLKDFKIEFGRTKQNRRLVIADSLGNDEWRLEDPSGREVSKQNVRDGVPPAEALQDYELVANAALAMLRVSFP